MTYLLTDTCVIFQNLKARVVVEEINVVIWEMNAIFYLIKQRVFVIFRTFRLENKMKWSECHWGCLAPLSQRYLDNKAQRLSNENGLAPLISATWKTNHERSIYPTHNPLMNLDRNLKSPDDEHHHPFFIGWYPTLTFNFFLRVLIHPHFHAHYAWYSCMAHYEQSLATLSSFSHNSSNEKSRKWASQGN